MSDTETNNSLSTRALSRALANRRLRHWRGIKDRIARHGISVGGVGAILAIILIFFYLLWVVIPLFKPADTEPVASYALPGGSNDPTLHLALEEQTEVGLRVTQSGRAVFFATDTGKVMLDEELAVPAGAKVTAFAAGDSRSAVFALGLDDGRALVVKHNYRVTFPNDIRRIDPEIEYPLGPDPVSLDTQGRPLVHLAAQVAEEEATLAGVTDDGRAIMLTLTKEESLLGGGEWEQTRADLTPPENAVQRVIVDFDQQELYLADRAGSLAYYDLANKSTPRLIETVSVLAPDETLTSLEFLTGGISLLVGGSSGSLAQWFPVRDEQNNYSLHKVREFDALGAAVSRIAPEFARKGFLAADQKGGLGIYHTTAHRTVLTTSLAETPVTQLAVSPRANALLAQDAAGEVIFWRVHNEHPDVSWSGLWGKVWYESYPEPDYIWQSSAATDDFEPKYSLVPITFGTLKAAFYAMLFAVPLAIMGAVFTAYFMAPAMRQAVKPVIEIMEALPTVILGFLAGLWLAPFIEKHLPGVFSLLLILPIGVVLFAYLWHRLPRNIRLWVPEGWEAALLIPVVCLIGWAAIAVSQPIEESFFGGDVRIWMSTQLGIGFDQRNSIVVGLAMGFAVIPTIFSIAEDAIFGVPRHLTQGSLALGATPWQTLTRVVILTASPGIFSAIMIGLGRAVGETMIVLMATGNTPVMDWSIFQGMRTLSANIAVEMPESEVNSSHYRVLFLAAMVLFLATFVFNTAAEIVRQRLRKKYSSL